MKNTSHGLDRVDLRILEALQTDASLSNVALAKQVNMNKLLKLWKLVLLARRHENHPLSTRDQLESLLLQYQQLFAD